MERSSEGSSSGPSTSSDESRETNFLSKTTGVRESRRFFNLTHHRTNVDNEENSEDDWLEDLEVFLKQTWNMLAVSVLYNFNPNDEVQLKQYAKKLREEVSCSLSQEDVSYEAKVDVSELRRPKDTDHPVIEIEVIASVVGRAKKTIVYKGYLISWRTEPTSPCTKNSTQLPLLLCRGTKNTMKAVHATLSRMFDCIIVSLPASAEDLRWLLPIVISPNGGYEKAGKNDEVHLEYVVPTLSKIETITLEFLANDLIKLWNSLMRDKDRIDLDEVNKFHEVILTQVNEFSSIQLGLCLLHKITLPAVLTISEIKLKVMNVEAMNTILTYLNEKALEALHVNARLLSISK